MHQFAARCVYSAVCWDLRCIQLCAAVSQDHRQPHALALFQYRMTKQGLFSVDLCMPA
jgi:hypothetical protein